MEINSKQLIIIASVGAAAWYLLRKTGSGGAVAATTPAAAPAGTAASIWDGFGVSGLSGMAQATAGAGTGTTAPAPAPVPKPKPTAIASAPAGPVYAGVQGASSEPAPVAAQSGDRWAGFLDAHGWGDTKI